MESEYCGENTKFWLDVSVELLSINDLEGGRVAPPS